MFQSEYGWTDEDIFNLTLRRAVQIKQTIEQRRELLKWEQYKLLEWQTQILASMMANTVEDEDARKTLVSYASSISLTKPPADTKADNRTRRPKTYRLLDGTEIEAKDLGEYSYAEIDHTEEDQELMAKARLRNKGKNLSSLRLN